MVLTSLMLSEINIHSIALLLLPAGLLGIMAVPLLRTRKIDWFSPWVIVLFSTFSSVFLRSIYIVFDIPDESVINDIFLLGKSKDFLLWPMVVVVLGLCIVTFGYLVGPVIPRKIPLLIFKSDHWSENRLWFVLIVLLSLAWIGFYLYIHNIVVEPLTIHNLSAKRGLSDDISEYRAYGYLHWMVNLSGLVFFIVVTKMISINRIRFRELLALSLSLGTYMLFLFSTQSRGGILFTGMSLFAILYYMRGKKFPVKEVMVVAPIVLLIGALMTALRMGIGYDTMDFSDFRLMKIIEIFIVNNANIDVSKTGHIMDAMGTTLNYQWGGTLLYVLFLWIPRPLWPGKPLNLDTVLGMVVYGAQTYGAGAVPPGFIGELYWNFWFPGIIIGCFLLGYLLKVIYTQFRAYSSNRNIVLIYVLGFMQLGVAFLGSSSGSALMSLLMTSIPMFIVLHFITKRVPLQ